MRTHYCNQPNLDHIGQTLTLCGWVNRRRDHGGVIFIDLRDRSGLVQIVYDPAHVEPEIFHQAEKVRNEYVLKVTGTVRKRPEGTVNPDLKTGQIEILAHDLDILNPSAPLPFMLEDEDPSEEIRLKYRYLDLRRPKMQHHIQLRHRVSQCLRAFLDQNQFIDIETPMLTKATPEGARDYLVPSRTHPGHFFALPQSPQLFKQLLMMAGMDRYYQIVRCFRDEDLRADRQPEFTQLDMELSFMDEEGIMNLAENMIRELFKKVLDVDLPNPFPRLSYAESMRRFGTDRPDLRCPLELVDVADLMQTVEFKVFAQPAQDSQGRVAVLRVPQGHRLSRKAIDDYTRFVSIYGAKGLAYIKVNDRSRGREGLQSPILKFLPDQAIQGLMERTGAEDGDILFFGADKAKIVNESLAALREKIGHDLDLNTSGWQPLWVVDFPLLEWDASAQRWQSLHHPFTAPKNDDLSDPARALSRAYDMVLNGHEIGGGSIRIHRPELQKKLLGLLGIGEQEAEDKFGFLLNALKYGCPPHGGLAFGLDRLVMLMAGADSIREVMAFPKTQSAACLLTDAPSAVSSEQLKELHLRLRLLPKEN